MCLECTRELTVSYYRIVGISAQSAEPIEKVVATVSEAEFHRMTLQRVCGKFGVVDVFRRNGRAIGYDALQRLIREEQAAKINQPV